eukprot:TRINITY_DN8123_c0_g1_i2.p1 TRINITY_DN8123_c0_g1~~TRINITY_DN8123_c0_g1_i2.p1  ORF type:complete len:514 (-),score=192.21 TRINITY_DN8123_c0_g1_i2:143-1684(-)
MVDNVSFKVVLKDKETEDELRRFVVDKEVSTSFAYLQEKLCLVFPQLKQKIFSVTWTDEDGDMVTIATDEELIIALTEMPGPVYKLKVDVKSPKKTHDAMNDSNQDVKIHHGVTCDVCEKTPIKGNRYKCVVCDDFDLCGSCEAAGRHPGHNMMRISNPEMAFPQRLFKRIHKMQERAEKNRSQQEKENGESARASPPMFGCPRDRHGMFHGRGMHGFGGMRGAGEMRGGFGGMGGMRGGCGAGAWAGPAFEAMMKGWMGEPQMGNQENKSESNTSNENQKAPAAEEAQKEANTGATEGASSDQEAMKAAFEQFATMTGSAEYLKNVGDFVAAALDPFGIDVQVNVETPEDTANSAKTQSSNSSSASSSSSTSDVEEGNKPEQKDAEKANVEKSKSPALDEEWTVVTEKEEEAHALNVTIKPTENPGTDSLYPSLPENPTGATASPRAAAPTTDLAAAEPEPAASHPDPKIQVALQAMMNMGFSNEGGWMTSLLEAKNGDIGKVLDILQPIRK